MIFERLADPIDRRGTVDVPARTYDTEGLRISVLRQLQFLLNTRVPLDIDTLEGRERTTIDYGIPDLSAFPLGQGDAMARLARHIARTISVYEPRLRVGDVTIEASSGRRGALVARVSGNIEAGDIIEPVSFALAVAETPDKLDDS